MRLLHRTRDIGGAMRVKTAFDLVKSDVAVGATNTLRPLTHPLELARSELMDDVTEPAEEWRPVPGFEGYIEVSSRGRVRSLDYMSHIPASRTAPAHSRRHKGKLLKQSTHPRGGYKYIGLCAGGRTRPNAKVHHLVLEAFVGPCPDGMECCHSNDIPADNRLENLRWDTRESNTEDRRGRHIKTHCSKGHEYTPENTRILKNPPGAKRCITCQRASYIPRVRQAKNMWTAAELEVAARMELSADEVATITGRSPRAVQCARQSLRNDPKFRARMAG